MGGLCKGASVVADFFENQVFDACKQCHLLEWDTGIARCQALDGREELTACPALEEHLQHFEIPLYGENRPPGQKLKPRKRRKR